MEIPVLAQAIRADDRDAWIVYRKLQALSMFPPSEIQLCVLRFRTDRSPLMSAAKPVVDHLLKNYIEENATWPIATWNHYDSIMSLSNRTTNGCETFHAQINRLLLRREQFFKIVGLIELFSSSVEVMRVKAAQTLALDEKENTARYKDFLHEMRNTREFLMVSNTFSDRFESLPHRFVVTNIIKSYWRDKFEASLAEVQDISPSGLTTSDEAIEDPQADVSIGCN